MRNDPSMGSLGEEVAAGDDVEPADGVALADVAGPAGGRR